MAKRLKSLVSEADMLVALGHHFARYGYECYPELHADLTLYHRGRDELIGIEGKKDLNFKVLDQALTLKRRRYHDAVLICVGSGSIGRFWAPRVCSHVDVGIGVLIVTNVHEYDSKLFGGPVVEIVHGARRDHRNRHHHRDALLDLLCPEAQVYATPGASGPQGFTAFRMQEVTMYRAIKELGPQGISVTEALGILGKKVRKDRLLELLQRKVFGTLDLQGDRITIRAPWGSREAGHSGIAWAPPGLPGSPEVPDLWAPEQPKIEDKSSL